MGNALNICIEKREEQQDHDNQKELYCSDCCMKREIKIEEYCDNCKIAKKVKKNSNKK